HPGSGVGRSSTVPDERMREAECRKARLPRILGQENERPSDRHGPCKRERRPRNYRRAVPKGGTAPRFRTGWRRVPALRLAEAVDTGPFPGEAMLALRSLLHPTDFSDRSEYAFRLA